MIIRNYKYTPEDVDCRYCTEFIHNRCRASKCPWLNERIEAGVRLSHQSRAFINAAIFRLISLSVKNSDWRSHP